MHKGFLRTAFILLGALTAVPLLLSAQTVADREAQLLLDAQRSAFSDQFDTILAGEREVVVVTQESTTPLTKGVAVIIGESGQGPFNQHSAADLATLMNGYGWVSMVMPAPTVAFFQPDQAQAASAPPQQEEQQAEPQSMDVLSEPVHPKQGLTVIEQEVFERQELEFVQQMQAIVSKTREYPGFFLVIAQGTSAAWLTYIYAEQKLDLPDALVVVSPYWPERQFNQQLPQWLANTQMPVLDVFSQWDNEWGKRTVSLRKIAAEKSLKLHYRQRELIGQMIDRQQFQLLSKEIYGWLTQMGW